MLNIILRKLPSHHGEISVINSFHLSVCIIVILAVVQKEDVVEVEVDVHSRS